MLKHRNATANRASRCPGKEVLAAAASRDAAIERQVFLLIAREPARLQTTDKNWLFAGNNEKHCKNCPGNK